MWNRCGIACKHKYTYINIRIPDYSRLWGNFKMPAPVVSVFSDPILGPRISGHTRNRYAVSPCKPCSSTHAESLGPLGTASQGRFQQMTQNIIVTRFDLNGQQCNASLTWSALFPVQGMGANWSDRTWIELEMVEKEKRMRSDRARFQGISVWSQHRTQPTHDQNTQQDHNISDDPPPPHPKSNKLSGRAGLGKFEWSLEILFLFAKMASKNQIDQVPDHACTPPLPNRTKPNRCDLHALIWTVSSATLHSLDQHFFQFKAWERTGQIELGLNLKWWRKRKECDQIERGSRASVFDHNTEPNQHKIRTHNKTTTFLMTQARSNKDLFTRRAGQLAKLLEQISNQPLHRSGDYS